MADFSGIDPGALGNMLKSFTRDASALGSRAQSLKTKLGSLGLRTGPVDELIRIGQ